MYVFSSFMLSLGPIRVMSVVKFQINQQYLAKSGYLDSLEQDFFIGCWDFWNKI